jgi:hypothetical protein
MNYDANWQFEDWLAAQLQFRVQALPFLPCLYPLVLPEQPIYELMSTFRTIPVDGRGHPKDIEPSFSEMASASGAETHW